MCVVSVRCMAVKRTSDLHTQIHTSITCVWVCVPASSANGKGAALKAQNKTAKQNSTTDSHTTPDEEQIFHSSYVTNCMPWNDIKGMYNSYTGTETPAEKRSWKLYKRGHGQKFIVAYPVLPRLGATTVSVCLCVCAYGIYETSATYTIRLNVMRYGAGGWGTDKARPVCDLFAMMTSKKCARGKNTHTACAI